jgi:hypothetical protein
MVRSGDGAVMPFAVHSPVSATRGAAPFSGVVAATANPARLENRVEHAQGWAG